MNISGTLTRTATTSRNTAALVVAIMGLTLASSAYAAGPGHGRDHAGPHHQGRFEARQGGPGMSGPGSVFGLRCGPRAAERIEHAFVSLSYRVSPTGEQVKLFDDLKAAALKAQADFSATCDTILPGRAGQTAAADSPAGAPMAPPDFLEAMKMRLKLEEARLDALGDVMPQLEAFYSSLSEQQKAALHARGDRRGHPGGMMDDHGDSDDHGPGPQRNG